MKIQDLFPITLHILFVIASNLSLSIAQPLCHDDERTALLSFKDSFVIDKSASRETLAHPNMSTWKLSDCCSWQGVKCDAETGHVTSLYLNSSFLFGTITSNSSLFQLSHLQRLNLNDNHFNYSPIPSELGRLSKLTSLNLSSSFFTGKIPSTVLNLTNLSSLDLSHNDFSSNVPSFFANMSSLTSLRIRNCDLYGEFPKEIFLLPEIRVLSITRNPKLIGSLPEFLPGSSLTRLEISNTSLSGVIPFSIENLRSLQYLTVARAKFSGSLPSSFGKLHNLTHLDFTSNKFIGEIPSFLQNLTNLGTLWFGMNQLTGQIPSWLGNITSLKVLSLAGNNLVGPVPQSLSRLANLRTLNLYENKLNGTLDFEFFIRDMKSLAELRFDENEMSVITKAGDVNSSLGIKFEILGLKSCNLSHFPDFLRSQDMMKYLDLGGNNIGGSIPNWIWNTSIDNLAYLALNDNHLTSIGQSPPEPEDGFENKEISDMFCNLNSLQLLDLSNNMFSGVIPKCFENLNNSLSVLSIRNNSFRGTIPQMCSNNHSSFKMIDLSYNQLSGPIPRSMKNCSTLESLNLRNNNLVDVFPFWLGVLQNLKLLILQSNHLHGEINNYASKSQFPSLRVIDLSNNSFSGKLPSEYFQNWNAMKTVDPSSSYIKSKSNFEALNRTWYLEYAYTTTITLKGMQVQYGKIQEVLVVIDFSSNKFHGEIPDSVGGLKGLKVLNFSNNILSGRIPSSLGSLSRLESLDLSRNKLVGEIPLSLVKITSLAFFNVSDNNLTGRIPRGNQFNTFESSSYIGNLGLCGKPLSKICETPTDSEEPETEDSESSIFHEFNWTTIVLGFGSGLAIGVVIENFFMAKKRELWLMKACLGWEPEESNEEDEEEEEEEEDYEQY